MISSFVASYGYLAVFFGTLIEGETILIAAGFAASQGLLDWPLVVLVAAIGATMGDQTAFLLGRWKGNALLARFPALADQKQRINDLIERFDIMLILIVRFLYGLRIAGPLIIGTSRVPLLRFAVLNVTGAILWAVAVSGVGYLFGLAIGSLFADLKKFEEIILIAILMLGTLFWLGRRFLQRMRITQTGKRKRIRE
jgi:membrane protein DedA with SNARE-associated domain